MSYFFTKSTRRIWLEDTVKDLLTDNIRLDDLILQYTGIDYGGCVTPRCKRERGKGSVWHCHYCRTDYRAPKTSWNDYVCSNYGPNSERRLQLGR